MNADKVSVARIAKLAGVSPATVSRVINHRELVKGETASKVEEAMAALHYTFPERRRPENHKRLIVVNTPFLDNPFYAEVLRGIAASADSHAYHILISQQNLSNQEAMDNFADLLRSTKVCGVILLSSLAPEFYSRLEATVPVVQCCEYNTERFSYVSIDDFRAAQNVMAHIHSAGRRKIAFLNGPGSYKYAKERKRGYDAFLREKGLPAQMGWYAQLPEINYDMAFSAASQMLNAQSPPDAVFAASDLLAAAVVRAAKTCRMAVPNDLIVVGFDNIHVSTISEPTITTVNQPKFQLGYTACEILNEQITNPGAVVQHLLLNTELIIRESSSRQSGTF